MFKALLKKQLLEVNSGYFTDKKTGERKSKSSTIGYILLVAGIFIFIAFFFVSVCKSLLASFNPVGLNWLYFSITTILSILLGTFGSVFNTYAGLYKSGDNDLLLSMPIKPIYIVIARLTGVFFTGFMYELPVIIPAIIVYWVMVGVTTVTALLQIIGIFVISILILSLSCILGYVVAEISTKIKSKAFISAIASILFLALYYFFYFKANKLIQDIAANADTFGRKIKSKTFFLYHLGNGLNGNAISFLIMSGIIIAIFAIVFVVINKSFVKLATSTQQHSNKKQKAKAVSAKKPKIALLKKELKRFTSSTVYLMNCGIGVVIMPIASIFMAVKSQHMLSTFQEIAVDIPSIENTLPIFASAMICIICSVNAVTAPSVSLEGKNLWVTQSLPVDTKLILQAKVNLGVAVNSIPALISTAILCVAFRYEVLYTVLSLAIVWLFVWFSSRIGLIMNLCFPSLNWTSETVPVKQSLSLFLTLIIGFVASMGMLILSFPITSLINVSFYMIGIVVILIISNILLNKWIETKGARIFEGL